MNAVVCLVVRLEVVWFLFAGADWWIESHVVVDDGGRGGGARLFTGSFGASG